MRILKTATKKHCDLSILSHVVYVQKFPRSKKKKIVYNSPEIQYNSPA